jgi:hypothetical protein
VVFKTDAEAEALQGADKDMRASRSGLYNIVLYGFIELINQLYVIGESVCN